MRLFESRVLAPGVRREKCRFPDPARTQHRFANAAYFARTGWLTHELSARRRPPEYPQRDSKHPANGHFVSFWDRTGTAPHCTYRTCCSFSLTAAAEPICASHIRSNPRVARAEERRLPIAASILRVVWCPVQKELRATWKELVARVGLEVPEAW
jgi:hypothetical protein